MARIASTKILGVYKNPRGVYQFVCCDVLADVLEALLGPTPWIFADAFGATPPPCPPARLRCVTAPARRARGSTFGGGAPGRVTRATRVRTNAQAHACARNSARMYACTVHGDIRGRGPQQDASADTGRALDGARQALAGRSGWRGGPLAVRPGAFGDLSRPAPSKPNISTSLLPADAAAAPVQRE